MQTLDAFHSHAADAEGRWQVVEIKLVCDLEETAGQGRWLTGTILVFLNDVNGIAALPDDPLIIKNFIQFSV